MVKWAVVPMGTFFSLHVCVSKMNSGWIAWHINEAKSTKQIFPHCAVLLFPYLFIKKKINANTKLMHSNHLSFCGFVVIRWHI